MYRLMFTEYPTYDFAEDTTHGPVSYLPHAIAATVTVTLAPAALVWGLAATGVVTSFVPLLAVGVFVSLLVAYCGRVLWQIRPGSRDLLFSDLMLWGWLRRWRQERQLGDAVALLGLDTKGALERGDELDPEAQVKALKRLATALEARDPYTHGHSRRVARYSTMIAKKLGVPAADVAKIRLAATVHDVGKLVVPLAILNKPAKLTDEEFEVIKRHAPVGADMVSRIGDDALTQIVAHHHERLDGSGYPSQLSGGEIPLGARIIAVADTFDALTSTRAYRPAKRHRDVFRILREEAGTQLDPVAVQAFSRSYSGFWGIAAWSIVSGAPQRVLLPFASQAPAAGWSLSAKALAALAAAVATGGVVTGSLTNPRDTNANPTGAPALAAIGADAHGVEFTGPGRGSAEPSARGDKQGENSSKGGPGGAGNDGSRSDQPSGGDEPSGGDQPSDGEGPAPLPDPGNLPGTDTPPNPGNPASHARQVVQRQLEPLGEPSGQLRKPSRQPRAQPGQLAEQLGPLG
jgi:putative nucleotidyltransferase with HDIG domain